MSLEITGSLKESLREVYYREGCAQQGWAYSPLQNVHDSLTSLKSEGILVFEKGDHSVRVKIMQQIIPEIYEIGRSASPGSPGFVFDYLACQVKNIPKSVIVANPEALCWVKLRSGRSIFTEEQVEALSKIKLPLALFQVRDVLASPRNVEIKWDIRSGGQWLDMLDEKKEQEEYDDEYF
jgi:hypothetical protein